MTTETPSIPLPPQPSAKNLNLFHTYNIGEPSLMNRITPPLHSQSYLCYLLSLSVENVQLKIKLDNKIRLSTGLLCTGETWRKRGGGKENILLTVCSLLYHLLHIALIITS